MTSRIEYTFVVHYYGHLIVTVVQKIIAATKQLSTEHKNFLTIVSHKRSRKRFKAKIWTRCFFLSALQFSNVVLEVLEEDNF